MSREDAGTRDPLRRLVGAARATVLGRTSERMIVIGGYDRALALSAQAFVALVPMFLVVAALLPDGTRGPGGTALVGRLGLSGDAAASVSALLQRPPDAVGAATVLGAVLLVVSVLGFTRSLQRTYLAAWALPTAGVRGYLHGLVAAAALVAECTVLAISGPLLVLLVPWPPLGLVVHAAVATLLWWPVQRLLLGGRVGWRRLLPGALVTGIGQAVVLVVSGIYLPLAVTHQADRYGLFGVAVALLSWLLLMGLLLVFSAVLGAELAGEEPDPPRAAGGGERPDP